MAAQAQLSQMVQVVLLLVLLPLFLVDLMVLLLGLPCYSLVYVIVWSDGVFCFTDEAQFTGTTRMRAS
jgi:hypothetical protein